MKSLEETIDYYVKNGMTVDQARNYTGQQVILNKISKSELANNILIKGGVVIFNLTHNLRRTTNDLDFDFIRYDISEPSIEKFIALLNKFDSEFKVKLLKMESLKQEDYKGKRVWVLISDKTTFIKFKLDIGVHTLLDINQATTCFYFSDGDEIKLNVNPPEQIFAEKLYSLAKHGPFSTRFKDVFDVYYFIKEKMLDKNITKRCIDLLLTKSEREMTHNDLCIYISKVFEDKQFVENIKSIKNNWLEIDHQIAFKEITNFINSL